MIVETSVGKFELVKNHKEAFKLDKFESRYVDFAYDKYTYLVGDISADVLRIKGFSNDPKSINSFKRIPDYLAESCNVNCAYFILKRVK